MPNILKNLLAVLVGVVVGCVVNIALVNLGPMVVALPEGADISTMEGLRESMEIFTPANFLFPFLGHALGTLVGAWVAAKLAASHRFGLAAVIGLFFLSGGVSMVAMVGGPLWFRIADLVVAYLPMAYLGALLSGPATVPQKVRSPGLS